MKKKLLALALVFALALTLGLTACNKEGEAPAEMHTGYAFASTTGFLGHTGLAMAKVTTADGAVTEIILDEVYFPLEWARMNADDVAILGEDNVISTAATTPVKLPKYLRFDGVMYTGHLVTVGTDKTNAAGTGVRYFTEEPDEDGTVKSLETRLGENTLLAKRYYSILKAADLGKIKYSKTEAGAAGDLVDVVRSNTPVSGKVRLGAGAEGLTGRSLSYSMGFFKGETNYAPGNAVVNGTVYKDRNAVWNEISANIIKVVNQIGLNNLTQAMIDGITSTAITDTAQEGAKINNIATGATVANMKTYVQMIYNAYLDIQYSA